MKVDKYMYAARDDAQVSVQTGNEGRRTRREGLREDKGRSRSKNSIISADARTSLGFPGADNGALFEESFCSRPRYPAGWYSLSLSLYLFSYASASSSCIYALPALFFSSTIFHSFYRMKIQSCSRTKRDNDEKDEITVDRRWWERIHATREVQTERESERKKKIKVVWGQKRGTIPEILVSSREEKIIDEKRWRRSTRDKEVGWNLRAECLSALL